MPVKGSAQGVTGRVEGTHSFGSSPNLCATTQKNVCVGGYPFSYQVSALLPALDCLQSSFSLQVSRVIYPKQARWQNVAVKRRETRARREKTFLFSRITVSSRPNPSRRSRPNFVYSVLV